MYSQRDIDELISCPKNVSEAPKREVKLVGAHWKNDMTLVAEGRPGEFNVFFRRSEDFPENFSIGLSYDQKDGSGETILLRCNGPHGAFNATFNPTHPHWGYHIHRATESAINAGLKAERHAEITTAYASYEEAVHHFVKLINLDATEIAKYFPDKTAQGTLAFEGGENDGNT